MSAWGNAKSREYEDTFGSPDALSARSGLGDDDDVASMYGATPFNQHVINEAPPPYGQQGSPKAANEFITVAVSSSTVGPDARGKQIMWYQFTARTLTHRWSVSKRFSDCAQFHDTIKRMKLHDYKNEILNGGGGGGGGGMSSAMSATTPRGTSMNNTSFGYFSSSMQAALASGAPSEGFDVPPSFPSKFHHLRGSHSAEFVESRRKALDSYFKGTLWFLQQLGLAAVGVARKPYAGVLRAAFAVLVDFLRTTSQTLAALGAPGASELGTPPKEFLEDEAAIVSMRGGPLTMSGPLSMIAEQASEVPRSKIIVEPGVRFTIVLFLPGVLLKDVFVETGAALGNRRRGQPQPHHPSQNDRTITVGGTWNSGINGLQSLREQGVFTSQGEGEGGDSASDSKERSASVDLPVSTPTTDREPSENGTRSILKKLAPTAVARRVLSDTLPRGTFELTFEVPLPFEKAHWYSEYDGGVLLLMWDAPQS